MKKNYEPGFLESFYKCQTLADYENKRFTREELALLSYEGKVKITLRSIIWTIAVCGLLSSMLS